MLHNRLKLHLFSILIFSSSLSFAVDEDGNALQDYQISCGSGHTCAVNDNGVQLWGSDRVGQGLDSIATDSEVSSIEWDPDTLKPQML
jgi:alpha-tubulin suppressor-like RCC1 family protein